MMSPNRSKAFEPVGHCSAAAHRQYVRYVSCGTLVSDLVTMTERALKALYLQIALMGLAPEINA